MDALDSTLRKRSKVFHDGSTDVGPIGPKSSQLVLPSPAETLPKSTQLAIRRRAAIYLNKSRIYTIFISVFIGSFISLSQRRYGAKHNLPESYALCTRPPHSTIYTVDPVMPVVECVVIHKAHILDSGTAIDITSRWGDKEKTGPVSGAPSLAGKEGLTFKWLKKGQAAYPGFADAHGHIIPYGQYTELQLAGSQSSSEVVARVRSYIISRPDVLNNTNEWILGFGWDQNLFNGKAYPTAAELEADPVLAGRPIVLSRVDGHVYWISQVIIDRISPLPDQVAGGIIMRHKNGSPTGILVDNAMSFVDKIIPAPSLVQAAHFFTNTMKDAVRYGLTSIHDAMSLDNDLKLFDMISEHSAIPIRIYAMAHSSDEEYWASNFAKIIGLPDDRLTVRSVKIFLDGALGSWGAALLEPYTDQPEHKGLMRLTTETLNDWISRFIADGWQVNVHCIGDRANHEALNAFERALANHPKPSAGRHRIEHAQIFTLSDIERMGKLGIIASVQPTHATSDMHYAEARLGSERIKGAYAWQTLTRNNVRLALGSDFPVEGINPLLGFYAAITRLDVNGSSPHGSGGWFPDERLSREQALHGMTLGPAYAAFQEDIIGSLTPGKRADIVVLDKDIMKILPNEILKTRVVATLVDGRPVHGCI